MIIFRKFEKKKIYQKTAEAGVPKIMITIPLALLIMRQLIIKPWRRSQEACAWKNLKKKRFKKLKIANNF